jgi:hypothetical protein
LGWWLSLLEITNYSGSFVSVKSILIQLSQVFTESVNAINYQDAKETALARNPKARFIGANASFKDD